jgi:hypothetical protein
MNAALLAPAPDGPSGPVGYNMAERVGKEKIARKPGYLYYLGKDGYVWQVPMRRTRGGRKQRVGTEKIARADGYLYFLSTAGIVSRVKRRHA